MMMKTIYDYLGSRRKLLFTIGILLLITPMVFAFGVLEETLSISSTPSPITVTHNLDITDQQTETLTVQQYLFNYASSTKTQSASSTLIVFSAGNSGDIYDREATHTNGTDTIHYNFYNNSVDHDLITDYTNYSGPTDGLTHTFPSVSVARFNSYTATKDHDFIIEILDGQYVPAGTYQDSVDVSLYKGANLEETVTMLVTITVEATVGLSIVDVGAAYNANSTGYSMDFGSLTEGESLEADAVARANTTYSISVYSYNGSKMKHETVDEYVPYTFSVDNTIVTMSSAMTPVEAVTTTATPSTGTAHRLKVLIDSYSWVPAGEYEDNLVFEITGN
mgnify:CR=1 FL=1